MSDSSDIGRFRDCRVDLPPKCFVWPPRRIFHEDEVGCKHAQSTYVNECASGLESYYAGLLGTISGILLLQLLVLLSVLLWLHRSKRRALTESIVSDDESLSQRVESEQRPRTKPGYALVLPAYYWIFRFECILCGLWIVYYGVCIWLAADPSQRWALTTSSPNAHSPVDLSPEFFMSKVLIFACNAVGTTLDTALIVYLSHQSAGRKIWHRAVRLGIAMGILSGTLSVVIGMIPRRYDSLNKIVLLSGYANDSLIRLIILLFVCAPILVNRCRQNRSNRASVNGLVIFKLLFALLAIGVSLPSSIYFPDEILRECGDWDCYAHVFRTRIFPARVVCFAPWAIFFLLNGLVLYVVLWQDSNYWRKAGVRGSMFHDSGLVDPLLGPGLSQQGRLSSPNTPRFHVNDIIDFSALSLIRRIGGGASSTVWEAKLRLDHNNSPPPRQYWTDSKRWTLAKDIKNLRQTTTESRRRGGTQVVRAAVKQLQFIDEITEETIEQVCCEAELLRDLGAHENIIGWFGICVSPPHMLLVTELGRPNLMCTHRSSGREFIGSLPLWTRLSVVVQITSALIHLHAHRVVMRDLKCCNVLFDLHSLVPKLCDFGIAKMFAPRGQQGDLVTVSREEIATAGSGTNDGGMLKIFDKMCCCCFQDRESNDKKTLSIGGTVEFMAPEVLTKIWTEEKKILRSYRRRTRRYERGAYGVVDGIPRGLRDSEDRKSRSSSSTSPEHATAILVPSALLRGEIGEDDSGGDRKKMDDSFEHQDEKISREEGTMAAMDIFSLGVLLWLVLYVEDPWFGASRQDVMIRVIAGERLDTSKVPECIVSYPEVWEDIKRLLHKCWASKPELRPKASSIRHLLKGVMVSLRNSDIAAHVEDSGLTAGRNDFEDYEYESDDQHEVERKRRLTF
mmetsp:Transcript_4128/g.6077  ORF Transcript_4128/g.6077 Transcript_4128/m.6077 type:complete len:904 (-) Transcript_4128:92-2803(-)